MRKMQKRQAEQVVEALGQTHEEIKKTIVNEVIITAMELLEQCQGVAIDLGNLIEAEEGEGFVTIPFLENYCELVYQMHQALGRGEFAEADKIYENLCEVLVLIKNSVMNDIKARKEAVFLPYKASMWDSLESVWLAAEEDPDCDAYVIPIPYYDKNPDGSFKQEHYEGDLYPEYVNITRYDEFDLEEHHPEMIFFHNPYDEANHVTSVHPFFYSKNLKKFTDTLVYIPYYSTTGGMSEGQYKCPAYYHADYIIIQAEKYYKFFDEELPREKLVPLGTPKFDRVIKTCNNPPEPPDEWKRKMAGKKVYFYNTSLAGMLANTPAFLRKMDYVFKCFMKKEDACLLWRPHPLMESTFESMRPDYKPVYDALKNLFLTCDLGIYDTTPDITDTIALSDVYIGDSGTSVTSLFGIAGKPLFILDNNINTAPEEEDWRGTIIKEPAIYGNNAWMITQGNKLYHSQKNNFKYEYFCALNEYAGGFYYNQVITIKGKHYVCPNNAQDILVLGESGIERRIELKREIEQQGAFGRAISSGRYLFLIPNNYPAIVRYNTETDEIRYFNDNLNVIMATVNGEKRIGGYCMHGENLFIASPVNNQVLVLHAETGKQQLLTLKKEKCGGCLALVSDGTDLWILPWSGTVITRWNPFSGEIQEYENCPSEVKCVNTILGNACEERPFSWAAFEGEEVYLSPCWANMYIRLNKVTGEMEEWKPAFEVPNITKNGYYVSWTRGRFLKNTTCDSENQQLLFSTLDRRLYVGSMQTNEWEERAIEFNLGELEKNTPGFKDCSEWMKYSCMEDAFNSLADMLDGKIEGEQFDKGKQMKAYGEIAVNADGTCGNKIYEFVQDKIRKR